MTKRNGLLLAVVLLLIVGPLLAVAYVNKQTNFAPPAEEMKTVWADQGWTNDERHWFHHAQQGTSTFGMPYEWLIALEQPHLTLGDPGLLMDQRYLSRLGFIPSPVSVKDPAAVRAYGYSTSNGSTKKGKYASADSNAANLPVGFTVGDEWTDVADGRTWPLPGTGRNARTVGVTCAACHTGQLEYNGNRVLVDGGAAMISLDQFRKALEVSIGLTKYVPGRFGRFAERVLGPSHSDASRAELKTQFDVIFEKGKKKVDLEKSVADKGVTEGFTRLDALNRIGNQVFQQQMNRDENIYPTSGPVSYPVIWNAPWFDWVQYNSSIQQPMIRNLGEAMGVAASVNLSKPGTNLFEAAIPVENIHEMELLLGGSEHPVTAGRFGGLGSPRWADLPLPPLDQALVAKGRDLYMGDAASGRAGLCVRCHLPPISSKEILEPRYWNDAGTGYSERYLALVTIPVEEIGTDCKTAFDMVYRTVISSTEIGNSSTLIPLKSHPADCPPPAAPPPLPNGVTRTNFGVALGEVVEKTKMAWYDRHKVPQDRYGDMDGLRPNGIRATVASAAGDVPVYKARPLNGMWATAPFLHNGSVPNLYLLLSTQAERDAEAAKFFLGSRTFDPKYLGFAYRANRSTALPDSPLVTDTTGLFELDTTLPGNRNTGHLFSDDKAPGGVGRRLSPEERLAIIEFIKSL
ncbi:MAG: di-heme-cytochrome C peroxidase [Acidobacteriota bacterium]